MFSKASGPEISNLAITCQLRFFVHLKFVNSNIQVGVAARNIEFGDKAMLSEMSAICVPCRHRCARVPLGGGHCLVVVGGGARNVRAPRDACLGLVVIEALVGGPVNNVATLGRASGRTCRVHAPSGGGQCLILVRGSARVLTPRGARRGLVIVGALVKGPVVDIATPRRESGHYDRARMPRGGGRCLVVVGGGACRVSAPCGACLGLVVKGALVVGPVVDLVNLGRA